MNTLDYEVKESSITRDRVWDTYLKGLLTFSYAPREAVVAPPVEVRAVAKQPVVPPPLWSTQPFQCMFFRVGKMLLAAPLITLREVVKHDPAITKNLPGQPSWSRGIVDHRGEIINLVDPGNLLVGNRHEADSRCHRYILLTDRPGIGFLCHDFVDMCKLDPTTVYWYQNRHKRPWLAGIHRERLCTIIDIEKLLPDTYPLAIGTITKPQT